MNYLKRKIGRVVPAWVIILVVVFGTAAGAFIWISNSVHRYVDVSDYPLVVQEQYMDTPYTNETLSWIFNYTIYDTEKCDGYVYIYIWAGFDITTSEANVTSLTVETSPGNPVSGSLVSGYPQAPSTRELVFVFENRYGGPFDFDESGFSLAGTITVYLYFTVPGTYLCLLRVTSTSS